MKRRDSETFTSFHFLSFFAGDEKDAGGEIVEIRDEVPEIWLLDGSKTVYFQKPDLAGLPRGDLSKSFAHW